MTSYIMGKSQGYHYSCLGKTLPNLVAIFHLLSTVQTQVGALALAAQMHLQNHLILNEETVTTDTEIFLQWLQKCNRAQGSQMDCTTARGKCCGGGTGKFLNEKDLLKPVFDDSQACSTLSWAPALRP